MNNNIPNGAHFLLWPSVFPDSESVSLLSKGLLNLEPLLCSSGYAPVHDNFQQRKVLHATKIFTSKDQYEIPSQHKDRPVYAVMEQL